jgi:hypothetical protein
MCATHLLCMDDRINLYIHRKIKSRGFVIPSFKISENCIHINLRKFEKGNQRLCH